MRPLSTNTDQQNIDAKYRSVVIVWFAILFSTGLFFLVSRIVATSSTPGELPELVETNRILLWVCVAVGVLTFLVSFILKGKLLKQSVEKHSIQLVVSGHIVAFALCEATCLFGLLAYVVTHTPYAYLLFALAIVGLLLHFPRKAQMQDAASERQRFGM